MATKTLVTTFDDVPEAEAAVRALHDAGFARDDLGWIARSRTGEEVAAGTASVSTVNTAALEGIGVGAGLGGLAGLLIGFSALLIPGVGPVFAAGPLMSALTGAAVGAAAGGIIDALVNIGVPSERAHHYAERLRAGAAIVTVTVDDDEEEALALQILRGEAYEHGHEVPWRISGYTAERTRGRPSAPRPSAPSFI
jgi:hypothetical protein